MPSLSTRLDLRTRLPHAPLVLASSARPISVLWLVLIRRTWFFLAAIATVFISGAQVYGFSMSGFNLSSKLRVASLGAMMRHDVQWFDEDDNSVRLVSHKRPSSRRRKSRLWLTDRSAP